MSSSPDKTERTRWAFALLILIIGTVVRLAYLDAANWEGDSSLHTLRAAELVRLERWDVLVGYKTASNDARLPALFHYLLALPMVLNDSPLIGLGAIALSNALMGPLLVVFAPRWLGLRGPITVALLLALTPSLVFFSRGVRNEVLIQPLLLAIQILQLRAMEARSSRSAGMAFALSVAAGQIHLSALFVLVASGPLTLLLMWRAKRHSYLGVALGILLLAPFGAHELQSGFQETRALTSGATGHHDKAGRRGVAGRPIAEVCRTNLTGLWSWAGDGVIEERTRTRAGWEVRPTGLARATSWCLPWLWMVLIVCGAAVALQQRSRQLNWIVASPVATFSVMALLGIGATYYCYVIIPSLALLAAVGAKWIGDRIDSRRWAQVSTVVLALCAIIGLLQYSLILESKVSQAGGVAGSSYSASYRTVRDVGEWVVDQRVRIYRYPSYDYIMLLDPILRRRPDRADYARPAVVPFWEQPMLHFEPPPDARIVSIIEGSTPANTTVLARFGVAVIVEGDVR